LVNQTGFKNLYCTGMSSTTIANAQYMGVSSIYDMF